MNTAQRGEAKTALTSTVSAGMVDSIKTALLNNSSSFG